MTCPRRGSDEVCEGINSMKMHIVHYFGLRIDARLYLEVQDDTVPNDCSCLCGFSDVTSKKNLISLQRLVYYPWRGTDGQLQLEMSDWPFNSGSQTEYIK